MALGDPYLSVESFKARSKSASQANDAAILAALQSASRQIDGWCGRTFNQSEEATIKYITARYPDVIEVSDLVSITELATDSGARTYPTTWATTDYDLFPFDAADKGKPYTEIRRSPLGSYAWPSSVKGVRITGIWGYPIVPDPVKEATYLMANRLKSLWDAPFGISGSGEMGGHLSMGGGATGTATTIQVSVTPIIQAMLSQFRVITI